MAAAIATTKNDGLVSLVLPRSVLYWHKCPVMPQLARHKWDANNNDSDNARVFRAALAACDWLQFLERKTDKFETRDELFTNNISLSRAQRFKSLVSMGVIGVHWFDAKVDEIGAKINVASMITEPETRFANAFYIVQATNLLPTTTLHHLMRHEFSPWFETAGVRNRVLLNLPSRLILGVNQHQTAVLPDVGASGSREFVLGVTQSGAQARYKIVSGVVSRASFDGTKVLVQAAQPAGAVYMHMLVLERM